MTDKPDTSPPALRALIRRLGDVAARSPLDDKETRDVYTACSLLRALAAEKEAAAKTIADLTRERDEAEQEAEHFLRLALVDPGANPTVSWKERAEKAEAERDEARERYQNCVTQAKDWQQVANDRSAEIVRLFRAVQSHETAHDEAVEQRELAWRCQHSLQKDYDEARAEAAAMRAAHILSICGLCRDGIPVEAPTAVLTSWFHRSPNGSWRGDCRADAIRRLPPSTAGRDLLARMERMRTALDEIMRDMKLIVANIRTKGASISACHIAEVCEEKARAALTDQPGEKA